MAEEIDLRAALNAVSDVVQNRPRPVREFDESSRALVLVAGRILERELVAEWLRHLGAVLKPDVAKTRHLHYLL